MLVIVAKGIPDAIRGKLKLWCIEVKPYVFLSGVSDDLARRVVRNLLEVKDKDFIVTIFESRREPPGYRIWTIGDGEEAGHCEITGLQLMMEAGDPQQEIIQPPSP